MNQDRACGHACACCYARSRTSASAWARGRRFETRIAAELRAPELLRATFERAFLEAIAFGSRHHQPLEASLGLARRWLEVCAGRRPGRGPDAPREVVVHEEP